MTDHYVVRAGHCHPWSWHATREGAVAALAGLAAADPAAWAGAEVVGVDAWTARAEEAHLSEPTRVVDAEAFAEAMGVVPPIDWRVVDGVERFAVGELVFGRVANQYARCGDVYLARKVRLGDVETYLGKADFSRAAGLLAA